MWIAEEGRDVTSTFQGMTVPLRDLYSAIHQRGWEVTKVKWGTDGFEAEAKNPTTGAKVKRVAPTEDAAVAHLLLSLTRLDYIRTRWARHKLGAWQTTFTDKLAQIAEAYAKAPVYDPKSVGAWMELAADSKRRYDVLSSDMHIEVVNEPEPYATAEEMIEDIHKNKHLAVTRFNADHPVWSADQVVHFRAVHNILGHAAAGGDFGWHGENQACAAHFPLVSPNAQKALFSECLGRLAYSLHTQGFGPHKIAVLDDLIEDAQAKENSAGHMGVHPSQSLPGTEVPRVASFYKNAGTIDPNAGWQSGVEPLLGPNGKSWREIENDPLGVHRPNAKGVTATDVGTNLARIDPEDPSKRWWDLQHPDGSQNREEMKKAIVNAFSAVLLSPQKDLRWNTIHYQDLADVVHTTEDPNYLHKRLEQRRLEWNRARKISPLAHKPFYREAQDFAMFLKSKTPGMTDAEAHRQANEEVQRLLEGEKVRLRDELETAEASKPAEKRTTLSQIEIKAGAEVARILREIMAPQHNPDTDFGDQMSMLGSTNPGVPLAAEQAQLRNAAGPLHPPSQLSIAAPEGAEMDPSVVQMFDGAVNPEAMGAYGAWMNEHLKSIAQISRHADAILDVALGDIHDHDGTGHRFRAYVLSLGINGVGPKVTSFAWLLLCPELSQLATIDTHMLEVLGRKPDQAPSPRDYFKLEREFRARLDGAGYNDLPLGLGQWAMWDYKRTGRDSHQDHAGLRPINFVQHDNIDWNAKAPKAKGTRWKGDPWWQETEGLGQQVGDHFDQTIGSQFRTDQVPFQDDPKYLPVTAATKQADELHAAWPLPPAIRTKIANYAASLEWPEGAELEDPAEYHITAVYAHGGWNDRTSHRIVKAFGSTDLPFEVAGLDLFGPDKDTVVVRLESKEASDVARSLMDALEGEGFEVSRYPGGYKAHVTIGKASSKPKGDDLDLRFRAGKLYVSRPRDLVKDEQEHHIFAAVEDPAPAVTHPDGHADVGAPGESIMQYLRGQLGMTTEQAWEFAGSVSKTR